MLYSRVARVSVGAPGGEAAVLDLVRLRFNVVRTDDTEANTISLDIYNLSKTTRTKFETTDNRVIVQAGYANTGLQLLAIGDIVRGSTSFESPQVVTSVDARDGGRALRDARAQVSYAAGIPAKTIVEDLVKLLEIDNIEIDLDLSGTFKSGWSFFGNVRDGLNKLAARFEFDWSIQNNTLQITKRREASLREAVNISATTGMIGSPARIDRTGKSLTKAKEPPGLRVTCLLNPALIPGDPVVIDSREFPKGVYRIKRVEHTGDTHGRDWNTELEVVEPTSK